MAINDTPKGKLAEYLEGDLGIARRHLDRLANSAMPSSIGVLKEISRSVEDCVARIRRDVPKLDRL